MGRTAVADIRKYVEWMTRGRRTNRIAYATNEFNVPAPLPGAEWQVDAQFNATTELSLNPELRTIFASALSKGAELVVQPDERWTVGQVSRLSDPRFWSAEEDAQIRAQAISGIGARVIAKKLNRSESAIRARASRIGLLLRMAKTKAAES
jgi:hypothetical protein